MTRLALAAALLACVLSGAALAVAAGSTPAPSPYRLACQETFVSGGVSRPVWYPCSASRP